MMLLSVHTLIREQSQMMLQLIYGGTELIYITVLKDLKCRLIKEDFGNQNSAMRLDTAVFWKLWKRKQCLSYIFNALKILYARML